MQAHSFNFQIPQVMPKKPWLPSDFTSKNNRSIFPASPFPHVEKSFFRKCCTRMAHFTSKNLFENGVFAGLTSGFTSLEPSPRAVPHTPHTSHTQFQIELQHKPRNSGFTYPTEFLHPFPKATYHCASNDASTRHAAKFSVVGFEGLFFVLIRYSYQLTVCHFQSTLSANFLLL